MTSQADVERPAWLKPLVDGLADVGEVPFLIPPPDGSEGLRAAAVLALFGEGSAVGLTCC